MPKVPLVYISPRVNRRYAAAESSAGKRRPIATDAGTLYRRMSAGADITSARMLSVSAGSCGQRTSKADVRSGRAVVREAWRPSDVSGLSQRTPLELPTIPVLSPSHRIMPQRTAKGRRTGSLALDNRPRQYYPNSGSAARGSHLLDRRAPPVPMHRTITPWPQICQPPLRLGPLPHTS